MKKILSLIFIVVLSIMLVGCEKEPTCNDDDILISRDGMIMCYKKEEVPYEITYRCEDETHYKLDGVQCWFKDTEIPRLTGNGWECPKDYSESLAGCIPTAMKDAGHHYWVSAIEEGSCPNGYEKSRKKSGSREATDACPVGFKCEKTDNTEYRITIYEDICVKDISYKAKR